MSILLAEDNSFIRQVFLEMLRTIGVGRVEAVQNGAEAVQRLRDTHRGHRISPDLFGFDVFICDLLMTPVNGLLTLRWVRTAKDSPNRFLPFIMLSGAADWANVASARDLGASEFLAKPFSAGTVYRHLLEVIDWPRPFIATHSYFGPDRRRKPMPWNEAERRVRQDSDITVVYTADRIARPKTNSDVWKFILPNNLREKCAGLGTREMGELPAALLEEAEAQLERSALEFTDWARSYVANLAKLAQQAAETQAAARHNCFTEINMLAHELRGQGGTFGYPLITVFGKMLYEATLAGCREDDRAVEVVKAHVDSISVVIREKVAGDGGKVGRELLASLRAAIEKQAVAG